MKEITLAEAYCIVSNNVSQAQLVEELLGNGFLDFSLIDLDATEFTEEDEEEGDELHWTEPVYFYDWLILPDLVNSDYEKLLQAGIPVLRTDYGDWVGITTYGSDYDVYVYPKLIKALFNIDTDFREIYHMKRGR